MNRPQFVPSASQAHAHDRKMRRLLGESLRHIAEQAAGVIRFDPLALDRLLEGLHKGDRYPPSTFGLYAALVAAIQDEDFSTAENCMARLVDERVVVEDPWQVLALGDPASQGRDELFRRFMDTDPHTRFGIVPPSPAAAAQFRENLASGFQLMCRALPSLAEEFKQLISQIILVAPDPDDDYRFDGGSSYMLWGGLFLNATGHDSDVAMVEVLVHESAHMLLFGFCSDEPLVLNDDGDLFPSPLRSDPRPMDGIYHSTYVSARMHWAMSGLLDYAGLDGESRRFAESARAADRKHFFDGYQVVAQFGELTATGRAVMDSALEYMETA